MIFNEKHFQLLFYSFGLEPSMCLKALISEKHLEAVFNLLYIQTKIDFNA